MVPTASPERAADTGVAELPVTGDGVAVTVVLPEARVGEVPYVNVTTLENPLAFTEPFNVAVVEPTDVAADVVTIGVVDT